MLAFLAKIFGKAQHQSKFVASASAVEPLYLAPGRGFTQEVVGESYRQEALEASVGGKTLDGFNQKLTAQLVFDEGNRHDPNAVGVLIDRRHVGYIPKQQAADFRRQILAINPGQIPVVCKAKITGGWDRGDGDTGHFGVRLSLASPLRATAKFES